MILSMKPLTLAEVQHLAGDVSEKKALEDYLKKFGNLSQEKAQKLADEIRALANVKISEEHIAKIVDFLPRDSEQVHKIFHDVSFEESETNAVLDIVKNY